MIFGTAAARWQVSTLRERLEDLPLLYELAAGERRAAHDMSGWERAVRLVVLVALLYAFLVGVDILGEGISGLGSNFADTLFRGVANPLGGLAVGVLATVLVQSSSVTTSTLVPLVGTGVLSVPAAVPMVMGANVGTTVTNTLASLGAVDLAPSGQGEAGPPPPPAA